MLPLRKYASFQGRAPRAEYWWFYLLTMVLGLIASILDEVLGLAEGINDTGPINGLITLAMFIPMIAVTFRRLHDTDRSGWWLGGPMIALIPVIGGALIMTEDAESIGVPVMIAGVLFFVWAIAMLVFMILEGNQGSNSYGPDPYDPDDLETVFA